MRVGVAAGPEARAAHLVAVRLAHDGIAEARHAAGMRRRGATREARHRKIEAAPEEMHRAGLAEEAAAEALEDAVGLEQRAPEAVDRGRVIAGMSAVGIERQRIGDLARPTADADGDAELGEQLQHRGMKIGYRHRLQRQFAPVAAAGAQFELVRDEVEIDLERLAAERDRRGAEPARGDVQRHLPAVVEPRRQREADLADNLRPKLQRGRGVPPLGMIELRPERAVRHGGFLG